MNLRSLLFITALSICTYTAAQEGAGKGITISAAVARASTPGQNSGAAYLTLQNNATNEDALLSASTPRAQNVELHEMSMQGDVMRMRQIPRIVLAPGAHLAMQPGNGYHLMLTGLKAPLKSGDKIPLTLRFQHAGTIQTSLSVDANPMAGMPMH